MGSVQDVMNKLRLHNLSFEEKEIVYFLKSVASGLTYLHGKGIIHR